MLVRRFAVVCLIIALMGAGLSVAMTQARRMDAYRSKGVLAPCLFNGGPACLRTQSNRR